MLPNHPATRIPTALVTLALLGVAGGPGPLGQDTAAAQSRAERDPQPRSAPSASVPSPSTEAASARAPVPGSLFLFTERFRLASGELKAVDRGFLFVPVRRDRPESGVVLIDFHRFPAAPDAPEGLPPIFRLHGGPGFDGLGGDLDGGEYYEESVRPLARISDVIVVGQRGIGSSKPNTRCGPPAESFPLDDPASLEESAASQRATSARCRSFWEERGLDLEGLNVLEAAADLDDVRAALGYDRVMIWGGSFGSHWGMAYMRHYPDRVARAVLTGLEGPDHTYDMPSWVLAALERVAADAEASAALRGRIPEGGLIEAWKTVVRRVESEPMLVERVDDETGDTGAVLFRADRVRGLADGYSRAPDGAHRMAAWPADILRLYAGDFDEVADRYLSRSGGPGGWPTASFFMLDCGSGISAERGRELRGDPAQRWVGEKGRFYDTNCPVWGSDLGEGFRRNFETEIPTVLVHGNWDLSTPFENARELAPYFENGKLVVVNRGTHGALGEALEQVDGFREALVEFLRSGDMSAVPDRVDLPPVEWVVPDGPAASAARSDRG